MSTILFVTWDGGGNVPPPLGIAVELQRRGNEVRVMGHQTQKSAVDASGLSFLPFSNAHEYDSRDDNSPLTLLSVFGTAPWDETSSRNSRQGRRIWWSSTVSSVPRRV